MPRRVIRVEPEEGVVKVRFLTTLQPIYLNVILLGLVPVATVGVVRAVSIPELASIAYIDTVLPDVLAT